MNALIRRGLAPQDTKRGILLFNHGVPDRQGFGLAQTLPFATKVEAYD